jgi:uncharacterized delta-60 repeat protein
MSHQRSKLLFFGRRATACAIVLLVVALMASGVRAHPAVGGAEAAPAPAPRPAPLSPPAGDLDPTFGSGGLVTTVIGSTDDDARAVVIQSDGKIVATGNGGHHDFALARYNTDGTLDASFGSDGMVTTNPGSEYYYAYAMAIQSDGKIVAAGQATNDFILARYNSDGTLDVSFGSDGIVMTDFRGGVDEAFAVAIQNDGKIVAAGSVQIGFALARYNSNGTLDTSFGDGGKVTTGFGGWNDYASAVAIQSDGKIVAAGQAEVYGFALARYNSDGTLDASFGNGGKVTTGFESVDSGAYAVAIQSDGKIVAAGHAQIAGPWDFALARYNSDGTLDATFGNGGKVTTDFEGWYDIAYSVAVQSDGKIVAAGIESVEGNWEDFALARYNSDGTLDASFGDRGMVTTRFGDKNDYAYSVAIQSDGKIVAAGYARVGTDEDFALARYNDDGTLDASFGNGGQVMTGLGSSDDYAYAMALDGHGKIVAAGGASRGGNWEDFALTRYDDAGSLDTTFGNGGQVTTGFGNRSEQARAVAIQGDGKIVAAGYQESRFGNTFALARYNSDGTLDASFGSGGQVTTNFGNEYDYAYAVAIQSDGKIVAAGYAFIWSDFDFALARYNSDGSLDASFGSGGRVSTDFGGWDYAYAVAIQSDGKIVVAGYAPVGGNNNFALARYNSDGSLDTSFGSGGMVTTDFGSENDRASAVAIQRDGKIVAAGFAMVGGYPDFALARYNSDGTLDASFGNGGKVTTGFGSGNDFASALAIQSDGKIVVAGNAVVSDYPGFALARYNSDGMLDDEFGNGGKVTTYFESGRAAANAVAIQSDGQIVAAGSARADGLPHFTLARYQVASTSSQSIADGASATLEGVSITNHSGAPCDLTVTRHPIPPGGAPADRGELPVLWQLATTCPSYTFDLRFSYSDTELLFGNNVTEAGLQASRAPTMNGPYSPMASVVDIDANTITVAGVTQLSWWGLISSATRLYLPLMLNQ